MPPDWKGCKFVPEETSDYPGYGVALKAVHTAIEPNPPPKRPY